MAKALASKQEIVLERPLIPETPNYVMFDLEGLPPHLDEMETNNLAMQSSVVSFSRREEFDNKAERQVAVGTRNPTPLRYPNPT